MKSFTAFSTLINDVFDKNKSQSFVSKLTHRSSYLVHNSQKENENKYTQKHLNKILVAQSLSNSKSLLKEHYLAF